MTLDKNRKLILASQSPRRAELLKRIERDFDVFPSSVEEVLDPDRSPMENAVDLAREKARRVADRYRGCFVVGADTLVTLGGRILGKPSDMNDARGILRFLSGREHQVVTGVAVVNDRGEIFADAETSAVSIKPLTEDEIDRYIDTGEPMDKAGAYAIQGAGSFMVESYRGSFSNIVGLPLETLDRLLKLSGYFAV
ncbi:MAG: septum formation protein Maf [Nitrospinae bacterium]|nr:septum formation protein Maf [Nitrospinota bacterium]